MQSLQTIAFYNCENLFDPFNHPDTLDRDFTPTGRRKWTYDRYSNKLEKLGSAISKIGVEETHEPPAVIGLSEIENSSVLKDLLHSKHLNDLPYDYIHYESYDERGIDVALLYNTEKFKILHSEPIQPVMIDGGSGRDRTRDILYVKGNLLENPIHLFILHLPSQRDTTFNEIKRSSITQQLRDRINLIYESEEDPSIMVLGDFNDAPTAASFKRNLRTHAGKWSDSKVRLYNPMELFNLKNKFTNTYGRKKLIFDQILFSSSFLNTQTKPTLYKADIFNPYFLQEWNKKYKGQPFRTYAGSKYLGGYSDHFPVYAILKT